MHITMTVPVPDDDEPESETGAREVAERAGALADAVGFQPLGGRARDLALLVQQLAACVTCYIEDNERRLGDLETSHRAMAENHGDRLDVIEGQTRTPEGGCAIEAIDAKVREVSRHLDRSFGLAFDRLDKLERSMRTVEGRVTVAHNALADEVDTRSPAWQDAYDQGYAAGRAATRDEMAGLLYGMGWDPQG